MKSVQSPPRPKGNRLKQLRAFCSTAQLGTITRAAEQVMSSQPAVSKHISMLERDLGVRLFERRGPSIALTRMGESIFEYTMPLVQAIDRLPDTFTEAHFGCMQDALVIGAGHTSATHLLPPYISRFRELYPDVSIKAWTGDSSQRLQWLRTYTVDLVVLGLDRQSHGLRIHDLSASEFVLITPLDHPLAGRGFVDFTELGRYRMVGHVPGQRERRRGDSELRLHGVEPAYAVEVDSWNVVKQYVSSGLGIGIVPEICVTERDSVWSIPLGRFLPPRRYGVAVRDDELLSLVARRFLESVVRRDGSGPDAPSAMEAQ